MSSGSNQPGSFDEFWIWYLHQHRHPVSRGLHYTGSILTIAVLVLAAVWTPWVLLALPVVGYGPSWIGHYFVEKNKPATFGRPFWAAVAEYRMFWLWATGRIGKRLQQAGVTPEQSPPSQ